MAPELPDTPEIQARLAYLRQLEAEEEATREAINTGRLAEERRLARARRDFRAFVEYVIKDEETGEKITLHEVHKQWIDHIDYCWGHGLHPCIQASFGHGKSCLLSVALPLFVIGRNQKIRIKIVSASDDIAMKRLGAVRSYIESDPDYHEVFPAVAPSKTQDWTKHQVSVMRPTMPKDPTLEAKGISSTSMGSRSDLIIFDDVNDRKNTIEQPKVRERVWGNFRSVYMSRLEPNARVVTVATRWHEDDVIGSLLKDAKMRAKWGFLVQRINEDITGIDCEFYYGDRAGRSHEVGALDRLFQMWDDGKLDGV